VKGAPRGGIQPALPAVLDAIAQTRRAIPCGQRTRVSLRKSRVIPPASDSGRDLLRAASGITTSSPIRSLRPADGWSNLAHFYQTGPLMMRTLSFPGMKYSSDAINLVRNEAGRTAACELLPEDIFR